MPNVQCKGQRVGQLKDSGNSWSNFVVVNFGQTGRFITQLTSLCCSNDLISFPGSIPVLDCNELPWHIKITLFSVPLTDFIGTFMLFHVRVVFYSNFKYKEYMYDRTY